MSCSLLSWKDDEKAPSFLASTHNTGDNISSTSLTTENLMRQMEQEGVFADVKERVSKFYPLFGDPSDEAVMQLYKQKPNVARTVR